MNLLQQIVPTSTTESPALDADGPLASRLRGLPTSAPSRPSRCAPYPARVYSPHNVQAAGNAIRTILRSGLDNLTDPSIGTAFIGGRSGLSSSLADLLHRLDEFLELKRLHDGIENFSLLPFRLDDSLYEGICNGLWQSETDLVVERVGRVPEIFLGDPIHFKEAIALLLERHLQRAPSRQCRMTIEFQEASDSAPAAIVLRIPETGSGEAAGSTIDRAASEGEDLGGALLAELMGRLGGSTDDPRWNADWSCRMTLTTVPELEPGACAGLQGVVLVAEPSELLRGQIVRELVELGVEVEETGTASGLLEKLEAIGEEGKMVCRVFVDQALLNHPITGGALLAGIEAVVASPEAIVRIEAASRAGRAEDRGNSLALLRRPALRSHLRDQLQPPTSTIGQMTGASDSAVRKTPSAWIDYERAVQRFDGDDELYRVLLAQFQLRYRALPARLEQERAERPATQVAELARRVAGVASNLGLNALSSALDTVCESLLDNSQSGIHDFRAELERIHAATCAAVDGILTEESLARARDLSRAMSAFNRPIAELLN